MPIPYTLLLTSPPIASHSLTHLPNIQSFPKNPIDKLPEHKNINSLRKYTLRALRRAVPLPFLGHIPRIDPINIVNRLLLIHKLSPIQSQAAQKIGKLDIPVVSSIDEDIARDHEQPGYGVLVVAIG